MFGLFKRKPTLPPEALAVQVHRRSYFQGMACLDRAEGRPATSVVTPCEAFAASAALTTDRGLLTVHAEHLKSLGMKSDEAFLTAMQNASKRVIAAGAMRTKDGVVVIRTDHGFAGAGLLLGRALVPSFGLSGRAIAMYPEQDHLLFASEDDPDALAAMLELAESLYEGAPELRSLRAVTFHDEGMLRDWLPPEDHALRARFAAAQSVMRDLAARELQMTALAERTEPLAHLAPLPAEAGGGLVGAWARDTSVLLPSDLDRLVLVDTPDQGRPRVELPFTRVLQLLPSAFEAIEIEDLPGRDDDEQPLFYRTRAPSFPSARMMAFLEEVAAYDAEHPRAEDAEVPAQDLLAAWDEGRPIAFDILPGERVRLQSPQRQTATVALADLQARLDALPAADRFTVETGVAACALMEAFTNLDGGGIELLLASNQRTDAILEAAAAERPVLLSSLLAKALHDESEKADDEDLHRTLLAGRAREHEPATLFPILRPRGYAALRQAHNHALVASRTGNPAIRVEADEALGGEVGDGFCFELVADLRDTRQPLLAHHYQAEQRPVVERTALLNLRAASEKPLRRLGEHAAWRAKWGDDYAASRLLLPDLFEGCAVSGARLCFAPAATQLWVTGSDDLPALDAVLDEVETWLAGQEEAAHPYVWRELLSGLPFTLRDNNLARWVPPADHPRAGRLQELAERVEGLRERSSAPFVGAEN